MLDGIEAADHVVAREVDSLVVRLQPHQLQDRDLDGIIEVTKQHGGEQRLVLEVPQGDDVFRVRADRRYSVAIVDELLDSLATLVGPDNLSFMRR